MTGSFPVACYPCCSASVWSDILTDSPFLVTAFWDRTHRWQQEFFENATAAFEPRTRRASDAKDRRISLLEQKLQRKHEVLSELMEEHVKLKKELGEL
jgi:hypothetical protein